jgi:pilus assembly protein Flp/PilA
MHAIIAKVRQFLKSEDGPTATEYAVMLALIIVVALVAIQTLGQNVSSTFQTTSSKLPAGGGS